MITGLPAMEDLAGVDAIDAEQSARQLGAAAAHQAGQAEDLAACSGEGDVRAPRSRRGVPRTSRSTSSPIDRRRAVARSNASLVLAADDGVDDLLERHLRRWPRSARGGRRAGR